MLAGGEINPGALEAGTLGFQAQALLEPGLARQADVAAGGEDAVPRYAMPGTVAQRPHHLPRAAGETGGLGHLAVGSHFAARDLPDDAPDLVEHAGY